MLWWKPTWKFCESDFKAPGYVAYLVPIRKVLSERPMTYDKFINSLGDLEVSCCVGKEFCGMGGEDGNVFVITVCGDGIPRRLVSPL